MAVVIFRAIRAARGGEFRGHIGGERGWGVAAFERQEVGDGLDRGAGGTRLERAVHHAAARGEIVLRADQPEDFAGAIVEHDGGGVVDVLVAQAREFVGDAALDELIEFEVERGRERALPAEPRAGGLFAEGGGVGRLLLGRVRRGRVRQMGGVEIAPADDVAERLRDRAGRLLGRQPAVVAHALQHGFLPRLRTFGVGMGIDPRGVPGQSGEQGGLGVAQIGERFAEVVVRCGGDAVVEVPEIEPIQIRREDLLPWSRAARAAGRSRPR